MNIYETGEFFTIGDISKVIISQTNEKIQFYII